ncbi:MAG: HAMP domain-containing histidine kinase [Micrococcales bacterium]|nr:HAMP domain-containing histidine kinase [Micrococcales bacterium]
MWPLWVPLVVITTVLVAAGVLSTLLVDTSQTAVVVVVAIVVAGGAAVAVHATLRPLRQLEATATAIAAGDLSQRVPQAPVSTEVGRLGAAIDEMAAQIAQASAAREASEARTRQFVADASHELATPLAAVRGYAELYHTGGPTALDAREALERVEECAVRMGVVVENLVTLSRADQARLDPGGAQPLLREPVDLAALATDAASDLRVLDATRQVQVVGLSGPVTSCLVSGDEHQLRQVLTSLVANVVAHTPAGSPVELAVGHDHAARMGTVEVRDHGPGIASEHAVFDRFSTVDHDGAGLGLAIVAAIVAAHRGKVVLVATPGGGATVRVLIPVAELG